MSFFVGIWKNYINLNYSTKFEEPYFKIDQQIHRLRQQNPNSNIGQGQDYNSYLEFL